jgi:hypothetical protein
MLPPCAAGEPPDLSKSPHPNKPLKYPEEPRWRARRDSNPRPPDSKIGEVRCLKRDFLQIDRVHGYLKINGSAGRLQMDLQSS